MIMKSHNSIYFVNLWPRWDIIFPDIMEIGFLSPMPLRNFSAKKWIYWIILLGLIVMFVYKGIFFINDNFIESLSIMNKFFFSSFIVKDFFYIAYVLFNLFDLFDLDKYKYLSFFFILKDDILNLVSDSYFFGIWNVYFDFWVFFLFADYDISSELFSLDLFNLTDYKITIKPYSSIIRAQRNILFESLDLINSYSGFDRLNFFTFFFSESSYYRYILYYAKRIYNYAYMHGGVHYIFDLIEYHSKDMVKSFRVDWFAKRLFGYFRGELILDDFGLNLLRITQKHHRIQLKGTSLRWDPEVLKIPDLMYYLKLDKLPTYIDDLYSGFIDANMVSVNHFRYNTNLYGTNQKKNYNYLLKVPFLNFNFDYGFGINWYFILKQIMLTLHGFTILAWNYYFFVFDFLNLQGFSNSICNLIDIFCFLVAFLINICI